MTSVTNRAFKQILTFFAGTRWDGEVELRGCKEIDDCLKTVDQ